MKCKQQSQIRITRNHVRPNKNYKNDFSANLELSRIINPSE